MPALRTPRISPTFSVMPVPGMKRAGRGEHALHAGARIRRAAHHAHRVVAGIDHADAQPVGVGVLHRLDHAGDAERREGGAAVLHVLQFQADAGQRVGDLVQRGVGIEVRLQPGESELHRSTPSCSMVGASGLKP